MATATDPTVVDKGASRNRRAADADPAADLALLSPIERAALQLREEGEGAQITDLGSSSAGINLNLNDDERDRLIAQFTSALQSLGFK
ncbi:hypothetical protein ABFT23_02035 [Nocardioides sp. C4-1]|uniref:hypothetical protein n=1 Tax=Nocardioides sp. C4-1 TaxID=3151851 RepID=UPI003265BFCF